jgi:hypothetical protein
MTAPFNIGRLGLSKWNGTRLTWTLDHPPTSSDIA